MPFTAGLAWGGWLADEWNWRMLFYVNVPLALAIAGFTGSRISLIGGHLHGTPDHLERRQ